MATLRNWISGARLRTLPAAIAPVALGAGAAAGQGLFSAPRTALALTVALSLQVGVNYANDYSDGIRGTDENRTGPARLTGGGLASPSSVAKAALICFALAAAAGLTLAVISGAWLAVPIGGLAIAAAWGYTGGPRPYGYIGLGEVFVFVFFGLVATLGTAWVQGAALTGPLWAAASGVGLLACALLVANNLRDIPTDRVSGKRTLAVLLGDPGTRVLYVVLLIGAFVLGVMPAILVPYILLTLICLPLMVACIVPIVEGARGAALISVLRNTGVLSLAYGIFAGIGFALSS